MAGMTKDVRPGRDGAGAHGGYRASQGSSYMPTAKAYGAREASGGGSAPMGFTGPGRFLQGGQPNYRMADAPANKKSVASPVTRLKVTTEGKRG